MVLANVLDGSTCKFDLTSQSDADKLGLLLTSGKVTALSILCDNQTLVLTRPTRFHNEPILGAELLRDRAGQPVGESIYAQAGDVRASITKTFQSRLARYDLVRTGTMQYNAGRVRR